MNDIEKARINKENKQTVSAVCEHMGVTVDELSSILSTDKSVVENALLEAIERNKIYNHIDRIQAEQEISEGLDPSSCYNEVCSENAEGHCSQHVNYNTQSCVYRMKEPPPSDPFHPYPSHAECVRILQRIGYVHNDEFGHCYGTDFAFHRATNKLWFAYIRLLAETKRISIDTETGRPNVDEAKAYFKDCELPDDVATVQELILQRDKLINDCMGK